MKNKLCWLLSLVVLSLLNFSIVFSQDDNKEEGADHLSGNWGGLRTRLMDKGLDFTIVYTGGIHSNVSGGIKKGSAYNGQLNFGLDIDFEKLSDFKGLTFHANAFWIHGKDGTSEFVGDFGGYNNLYSEKTVRLYTFWLQKNFHENMFSLRAGSIAMDDEFGGSDFGALFINSNFGVTPAFSANMPVPIYAIPALGVRGRVDPMPHLYIQLGIFDGNPSHIGSDGEDDNLHGTDFRWKSEEGSLLVLETGYELEARLKGTYKVGLGYHTAKFALIDAPSNEKSGDYTVYFAADQMLFHPEGHGDDYGIGAFFRIAFAPKDRNTVSMSSEFGISCQGLFGREKDKLGLGFAYAKLNPSDSETVLELTYLCQLKPWFSLQPDIQYILNPSGENSGLENALVVGIRGVVSF